MSAQKPVIVLGDHVQALSIVREFGKRGIRTALFSEVDACIPKVSRYLTDFVRIPPVHIDPDGVIIALMKAPKRLDGALIFCTTDEYVGIVSKHKGELSKRFAVPVPDFEIVQKVVDKKQLLHIARETGITVPLTEYPTNQDWKPSIEFNFPAIVKGRIGRTFYRRLKRKGIRVISNEEIRAVLRMLSSAGIRIDEIMVQEDMHASEIISYCALAIDGEPAMEWMGSKIREHPMSIGTATAARSVWVESVAEQGRWLLRALRYDGICEIEFGFSAKSHQYILIEMNPRTWLWVSLAIHTGVNLLMGLYRYKVEGVFPSKTKTVKGIYWIHLATDFPIGLMGALRGRWRFKDYLSTLSEPHVYPVFDKSDPIPFLCEILLLPLLAVQRGGL